MSGLPLSLLCQCTGRLQCGVAGGVPRSSPPPMRGESWRTNTGVSSCWRGHFQSTHESSCLLHRDEISAACYNCSLTLHCSHPTSGLSALLLHSLAGVFWDHLPNKFLPQTNLCLRSFHGETKQRQRGRGEQMSIAAEVPMS